VKEILQNRNRLGDAVITGLVPQQDGSSYLAACDILALPTVPNPDGSPFFGSPTKLFEYMAMGRGIAASAIGQITKVLQDKRTALLVPPADAGRLAHALERLVDDSALRARLGVAARVEAELRHSWGAHVSRLIERIGTLR
jgi:glycosyltransferase involved in cell wall biosynthesis